MRHFAQKFLCLVLLCTGLIGCRDTEAATLPITTSSPTATPQQIEVTRIVEIEHRLIVTATPAPPVPCAPTEIQAVHEIAIGLLAPLTGNLAPGVASMLAGANFAVDAINQAGGMAGKRVRLLVADTASNPTIGAQRAETLITQDCVVALIGVYESPVGLTVKEVAHRYATPILFIETYNDEITACQYPEVFRIAPGTTLFSQMAAHWLERVGDYNQDGEVSAVIISENSEHGRFSTQQTVGWLDEHKIAHEELIVDLPAQNFSPVIARLVAIEMLPDAILIRLTGDAALQLTYQLLDKGIGPQRKTLLVLPQVALNSSHYWQLLGERGTGLVALRIGAWPTTVSPIGEAFAKSYEQSYQRWPDHAAFSAYDAIYLIVDAIRQSQSLQSDHLIQALEATDLTLASGHYRFPVNAAHPPDATTPAWMWHQWLDVPLLYLEYTQPLQDSREMAVIWPPLYQTVEDVFIRP